MYKINYLKEAETSTLAQKTFKAALFVKIEKNTQAIQGSKKLQGLHIVKQHKALWNAMHNDGKWCI